MTSDLMQTIGEPIAFTGEEKAEALDDTGWANGFGREELEKLARFMEPYRLKAGTTLFREGDPGLFMVLVIDGSVKVLKEGDDGYDHVLAEVYTGAPLGEMALVDGHSRSASAITSKESDLLVLTGESFVELGNHHPRIWGAVLAKLSRLLSERLRATSDDLVDVITATGYEDERY